VPQSTVTAAAAAAASAAPFKTSGELVVFASGVLAAAVALHKGLRAGLRAVVQWACREDDARRDAQHEATTVRLAHIEQKVDASDERAAQAMDNLGEKFDALSSRLEHITGVLVEKALRAPA
jgi:hypothetical protein